MVEEFSSLNVATNNLFFLEKKDKNDLAMDCMHTYPNSGDKIADSTFHRSCSILVHQQHPAVPAINMCHMIGCQKTTI